MFNANFKMRTLLLLLAGFLLMLSQSCGREKMKLVMPGDIIGQCLRQSSGHKIALGLNRVQDIVKRTQVNYHQENGQENNQTAANDKKNINGCLIMTIASEQSIKTKDAFYFNLSSQGQIAFQDLKGNTISPRFEANKQEVENATYHLSLIAGPEYTTYCHGFTSLANCKKEEGCLAIFSYQIVLNPVSAESDGNKDYISCQTCFSETLCDGLANECNKAKDQGCLCQEKAQRPCGIDRGICRPGHQICQDNIWSSCRGAREEETEKCDGLDNDCDGNVDEDFKFSTSVEHCGSCGNLCLAPLNAEPKCVQGECKWVCHDNFEIPIGGDGCTCKKHPRGLEVCDGFDNDCDGEIDEEFDLKTDLKNCGFCGNVCQAGPRGSPTCQNGICLLLCQSGYLDRDGLTTNGCECETGQVEICDSKDNDCDGLIDEDNICQGEPCKQDADCCGKDPCSLECHLDWPGGLCSNKCNTNSNCSLGSLCSKEEICLPICHSSYNCRNGYKCLKKPLKETGKEEQFLCTK